MSNNAMKNETSKYCETNLDAYKNNTKNTWKLIIEFTLNQKESKVNEIKINAG